MTDASRRAGPSTNERRRANGAGTADPGRMTDGTYQAVSRGIPPACLTTTRINQPAPHDQCVSSPAVVSGAATPGHGRREPRISMRASARQTEGDMATQPAGLSGGERHRTVAVVILAAIAVIAGIWNVMDTFRYLGLLPVVEIFGMGVKLFNVNWLGAILSGLVAAIWFAVAGGIWRLGPGGVVLLVFLAAF